VDQTAKCGLLLDYPRVILDVRGARDTVGERRDVGRAADFVQLPRARQRVLERNEIDRVPPLAERHHLVEDAAVRVAEEVVCVDQLRGLVERLVVDQDCAEDRLFGVQIVREDSFRGSNVSHESSDRRSQIGRSIGRSTNRFEIDPGDVEEE
jgi:hypothetical protein